MPTPPATSESRKKKKKNKKKANAANTIEIPISQQQKSGSKAPKNGPSMNKTGLTVITSDEARKMVPNIENQQATIIKTSDNMVTIRSPALQQAMNMHAYQNSHSYKPGMNGYNNVSIFKDDVDRLSNKMGNLKLETEDRLTRQMRDLNIKDGSRASEIFAQAMAVAVRNEEEASSSNNNNKKKKKKKKQSGKRSDEKEVEPVGKFWVCCLNLVVVLGVPGNFLRVGSFIILSG